MVRFFHKIISYFTSIHILIIDVDTLHYITENDNNISLNNILEIQIIEKYSNNTLPWNPCHRSAIRLHHCCLNLSWLHLTGRRNYESVRF